ncbi:hypothetical protein [Methanogenium organophilum]|uniref:Peptidase S54 rhomboid domain-containing protein n=1 Tax=Methanogenium organophilum TaxID=2199 RepID=A0A9X9T8E3_METOG|nr:hypothetical protein [Methanogenium organophilum]WAI01361.1 hypothetical protein OU421_00355 [Methanogenium organophilum]
MNTPIIKRVFQLKISDLINIILFIIVLPFLILLLQFVLYTVIIPLNISCEYVALVYEKPTISGMFFSNYIHSVSDMSHFTNNFWVTVLVMGIISGMIFIVMPAYEIKISWKNVFGVFFIFLFILPFIISATTMYFKKAMIDSTWSFGFSGIISALLGFALFLILWWFFEVILKKNYNKNPNKITFSLLFVSIIVCLLPLWYMLSEIGGNANVFAHMMGYSFGLITPAFIGLIVLLYK